MKPVMAVVAAAALVLGRGALPAEARVADGKVTSISVIPASGKAEVVVGVAGGIEVRDFTLRSPDRIVLDLSGVSLGLPSNGYDHVARGGITDVRYAQNKPGTVRVVVMLTGPHSYQISKSDGELRVTVNIPPGPNFAAWQIGRSAAPLAAKPAPVQLAGKPAGEPPVSGPDRALEKVLPLAPKAESTPRSASKPARAVEEEREPDAVPMRSGVQQTPQTLSQLAQQNQQRSQQPKISVNFRDSDIRDVLASFAAWTGRTIIPSTGVGAIKVDAEIKEQPWDVALRAVLNSHGLAATEDENGIIIVDTQERIAANAATEQLSTRIVRLNYSRATAVGDQIRQRLLQCIPSERSGGAGGVNQAAPAPAGQPPTAAAPAAQPSSATSAQGNGADATTCRGRGSVSADEVTNSISITAPGSAVDDLVAFANSLDLRQPQVSIKAKIVLVNRTDLDALGIKYDLGSARQFFSQVIQRVDSAGNVGSANDAPTVALGGNTVSAIANASGNVPGAALRLIYSTALGNFDFSTFLDALQEVNLLDVQSEPSVTTLNNRQATLVSGSQVPFVPLVSSGGSGTSLTGPVTVERVQTGVTLLVTPSVTNNKQIMMHVEVTNSDVNFTNNGTLIDNNNTKNDLLIADGQTVVIGGLTQTSVRVTKSGIPMLVDLPLIGRLFGYTTRQEQRRDLLVLITPHIIDDGQAPLGTMRP